MLPVSATGSPEDLTFDPLAVENVGVTLAMELVERPLLGIPPPEFYGAGIYALYYHGANPAYRELTALDGGNCRFPLYIGKAAGESAKQGFNPRTSQQKKLFGRINEHAASIDAVENLSQEDFKCRYLVLNDAYITLAESVMIRLFRPAWNGMSFGSKVVGGIRMAGRPSLWDSLHQGRLGRPSGSEDIAEKARDLIRKRVEELQKPISDPVLRKMHDRISRFF